MSSTALAISSNFLVKRKRSNEWTIAISGSSPVVPLSSISSLCMFYRVVRLYACNARTLTHLYYLARHAEQSAVSVATSLPFGSVTVRALLQRSHLRVEVLNARHLRPVDVLSR